MRPSQHQSRINLAELKAQIVKRLGKDKAHRYFSHLTRLFSQRLSKVEFDKLCRLTIGRENLSLHNRFIRSILRNACNGRVTPPKPVHGVTPMIPEVEGLLQMQGPNAVGLANGEILASLQGGRSTKRDGRLVERPSPLGPNGRTETATSQRGTEIEEKFGNVADTGAICACDVKRPICHHQGLAEKPENEGSRSLLSPSLKGHGLRKSPHAQLCVNSKGLTEIGSEDSEPVTSDYFQIRSPIRAPLGIPFCAASLGGSGNKTCRISQDLPSSRNYLNLVDGGELPDTETLRKRMDHIAEAQGLPGVTIDCANLLNNGLDAYLKRLIRSCIEISRSKSQRELTKTAWQNPLHYEKIAQGINGMWHNIALHSQTDIVSVNGTWEIRRRPRISLEDFRVVMELNPCQLGDDWPLLLEKIYFRAFEEE